ncbi:PREDICTED: UPF0481 protein At3g47200-like [Populus euphratica]|uniref:UPF0481 protein At3g47200-like n=1 Tax=Populus euphratica TaxID=75702 RepID=A0AAJ6V1Q9_POPEU|nr:PREDICTED: UPF0481 protein At3g47200-like [Populus euphratica]XP_011038975.1 PREDICTED: UPF0481 protein At3g47200-like [Populus euphratica]
MGEIRSPYFSLDQYHYGDNSDIHSPCFSYGVEDFQGDNAEIHPPYSSAGDYLADNTEIHSEALFHQDISGNSYNAQQFVKHGKVLRHARVALTNEQESDVCIYRVGEALRKSNEAMYSPQKISIGPIHHGNRNLRFMEGKKYEYYEQFWNDRVSKSERKRAEDEFWDALQEDENKIRQRYEDGSHGIENSEDFLDLILYDAVFIFQLFLKYSEDREEFKKDSVLKVTGLRLAILRDLILFKISFHSLFLRNYIKNFQKTLKENTRNL